MSGSVKNLPRSGDRTMVVRGHVENGEIVIRTGPADPERDDKGVEVFRFDWKHHLHRTEVHESVLQLIADTMAQVVREGRDIGYAQAQRAMRQSMGLS